MKKRLICILSATIFLVLILANMASAVVYTGTQDQTVDGQDFTFIFDPVLFSDGTDGSFTIEARGDYFGKDTETLGFNIDNIFVLLSMDRDDPLVNYIYTDFDDDRWWKRTWTVPGADLISITSDASGAIEVNLDLGVEIFSTSNDQFVSVKLEYTPTAVPIPGAIWLLGSGLVGIARIRRKFKK